MIEIELRDAKRILQILKALGNMEMDGLSTPLIIEAESILEKPVALANDYKNRRILESVCEAAESVRSLGLLDKTKNWDDMESRAAIVQNLSNIFREELD